MLQLNDANYYSVEADRAYMSYSQYKTFRSCEARALAQLAGWRPEPSIDMLAGSYVHAWAEGALAKFKAENPDIFTAKGELKAQFRNADEMIQTLEADPLVGLAMQGEKEIILTAEFEGCWWKAKLDIYNPTGGRFADIKTARCLDDKVWSKSAGRYEHFVEARGYIGQMALYQELDRLATGRDVPLDPYLIIVTKESPPNKEIVTFEPIDRLKPALDSIRKNLPRVLAVKAGQEQPTRCGICEYCRGTKVLTKVWDYDEFLWEVF
jgi:hypothetical protein